MAVDSLPPVARPLCVFPLSVGHWPITFRWSPDFRDRHIFIAHDLSFDFVTVTILVHCREDANPRAIAAIFGTNVRAIWYYLTFDAVRFHSHSVDCDTPNSVASRFTAARAPMGLAPVVKASKRRRA